MSEPLLDLNTELYGEVHRAWQALLSDPAQSRVAIRPVKGSSRPPAFITISFEGATPVPGIHVRLEPRSRAIKDISYRGFSLATKRQKLLGADSEPSDWAILECGDAALTQLFLKFSERVIELVTDAQRTPSEAIKIGIRSWLDFFKRTGSQLDREELTGLYGELALLESLLIQLPDCAQTFNGWLGPEGAIWDFTLAPHSVPLQIEVKTTLKPNTKVSINGQDQLWARDDKVQYWLNFQSLHHREQDDSEDKGSIIELINRIITRLMAQAPEVVPEFKEKLELAGLYESHREYYRSQKFSVFESRWMRVTKEFPGLHRAQIPSDIADRVERLQYTLNLSGLSWTEDPIGLVQKDDL